MIPIQKLASLLIRTFSRPLSNQIKRYAVKKHVSRKQSLVKYTFVLFGNKYHNFETFINRKFLGQNKQEIFYKPLTDELALQKGAELFADLFVYACVLGIPIYEIYKQVRDSEKKQIEQDEKLQHYQEKIIEIKQLNDQFVEELKKIEAENIYIDQQINFLKNEIDKQINLISKKSLL